MPQNSINPAFVSLPCFSDLAEQELFSEQKVKKDSIPQPQSGAPSAYPKIDLKDIARYVSLYRNVATKLFGEALDSAKKGIDVLVTELMWIKLQVVAQFIHSTALP